MVSIRALLSNMKNIDIYEYTSDELQNLANELKDIIFQKLEKDSIIVDADRFSQKYCVLLVKKGFFGKILDKFFGASDEGSFFHILKID